MDLEIRDTIVYFETSWGDGENEVRYEKGETVETDIIPTFFQVTRNYVYLDDVFEKQHVVKYFEYFSNNNKLIYIEDFKKGLQKDKRYKKAVSFTPLQCKRYNESLIILLAVQIEEEEQERYILVEDTSFQINVLNDRLNCRKWQEGDWFEIAADGSIILNQGENIWLYSAGGDLEKEETFDRKILYIDKYKNIYVKKSIQEAEVYNLESGFQKPAAVIEVPPEVGPDFHIDGGDVDSFIYQWKVEEPDEAGGGFSRGIHLYQLHREPGEEWLLLYKGFGHLGRCRVKKEPEKPHEVMNYIDARKELIQVNPDGAIYHIERDEKSFRIIRKIFAV
ncbi:MAG: hypothetical protein GY754_26240 [bacterium]|nr:hypothetical protein [bacterium]